MNDKKRNIFFVVDSCAPFRGGMSLAVVRCECGWLFAQGICDTIEIIPLAVSESL